MYKHLTMYLTNINARTRKERQCLLANQERYSDIQFGPCVRFSSSFLADVENFGLVVYSVKHKQSHYHTSGVTENRNKSLTSKQIETSTCQQNCRVLLHSCPHFCSVMLIRILLMVVITENMTESTFYTM